MEKENKNEKIVHEAFEIGITLKGIDGLLEIIGGVLIIFVSPSVLNSIIVFLAQHELSEDPHDLVANYLLKFTHDFSLGTQIFGAAYLLSHGLIKLLVVGSLWKNKLWAYPAAIIFFIIFILYQLYRYSFTHSLWLILLSIFDGAVVWLTWKEYQNIKSVR